MLDVRDGRDGPKYLVRSRLPDKFETFYVKNNRSGSTQFPALLEIDAFSLHCDQIGVLLNLLSFELVVP